jgi:hypothetical protein
MPELTPESTSPPAAAPATITPSTWEDFPVFRETFLMYISEPAFNASLRTAGEHFFTMMLETYDRWPQWQESSTRTELRAAVADLRHLQGFLKTVGTEHRLSSLDMEDAWLSKFAAKMAPQVGRIATWIERELRGERADVPGNEVP